jgi:Apea-like HEPN
MSANPMIIPESERYGGLKPLVFEYVDIVARIRDARQDLAQQWPQFFLYLALPWVVDPMQLSPEQKEFLEGRKREITELGFDGAEAKKRLEDVLARDKHLADCCPTLLHFSTFLDTFFITAAADAKRQGADQQRLGFAYDEFENLTYRQGRFKRIALSHIFNLNMEGNSTSFEGADAELNIRIERLDGNTIPGILGESGFQAFLHPAGIGDCFVVEEEGASEVDDLKWLFGKWQKALAFAQVLQYFQDGVVHIGYSVPLFQPNWANQIRRTGLFFLGEPRRIAYEGAEKMYMLGGREKERLTTWWKAATTERIASYVMNKKGKLRQAIYRAGTYYESSHQRVHNVERLLALAVAVESLFSPTDKGELKFRISQSAAQFIGQTPDERERVFKSISKMYDLRSMLVHGSYNVDDYDAGRFVSAGEIDEWASYLRRALLGFLTLYFRGDVLAGRDMVLQRIATANFDDAEGDKLRKEADLETLFAELSSSPGEGITASVFRSIIPQQKPPVSR